MNDQHTKRQWTDPCDSCDEIEWLEEQCPECERSADMSWERPDMCTVCTGQIPIKRKGIDVLCPECKTTHCWLCHNVKSPERQGVFTQCLPCRDKINRDRTGTTNPTERNTK